MLNCPFCENDDLILVKCGDIVTIECRCCGCHGPQIQIKDVFGEYLNLEEAINQAWKIWNSRKV
jgi:Zn ribbon nucleic-acid-binding protein